jgi:hypothetical protein
MKRTPSTPPNRARIPILKILGLNPHRNRAGIVKMIPEAKEELAEPVV